MTARLPEPVGSQGLLCARAAGGDDSDFMDSAERPLSMHAYLAEQIRDESSTAFITIIIKVFHNLVELPHQLLVLLKVTAAKLSVHYAEVQLPLRAEGRLEVQTLRV